DLGHNYSPLKDRQVMPPAQCRAMPSRHIEPGQSPTTVDAVSYYGKGARHDAVSAWPVSTGQRSIGIGATMSTGTPGRGQPFPGPADVPVDAIVLRMLLGAQL